MSFFDKVSETFSSKSKDVVDKAKEIAEVVNLNSQVSSQESLINKYFKEMGQYLYEHRGEDVTTPLEERYGLIDAAYEEIARLKKEILEVKGLKACPACGNEMPKDVAYCSKCGTQVPVAEPKTEEAGEETASAEETVTVVCGAETTEEAVAEETTAEEIVSGECAAEAAGETKTEE